MCAGRDYDTIELGNRLETAWHRKAKHEDEWAREEEIRAPIPTTVPNR
jgi:hypothetical protein